MSRSIEYEVIIKGETVRTVYSANKPEPPNKERARKAQKRKIMRSLGIDTGDRR
jgi:hypothetical protein